MKRLLGTIAIAFVFLLSACAGGGGANTEAPAFQTITATQARELMEDGEPFILLDVRNPDEFASQRIDGAILIPATRIGDLAPEHMPDLDARILLYCRSGSRSSSAARALAEMGYTYIYDFGGIIDWPYETIRG
ncbi:MAG: rhodanese-like domain-containing protein [Oscillospiraceae bacterium]|nr:rhodanese-like domain-containing protein [Oscillospiraceae bacterium]